MTKQNTNHLFGKHFTISLVADAITFLLTFINSIIVARLLGSQGRGEYAVLLSIGEISSLILSAGIYWGITYWLAKEPDGLPRVIGSALMHLLIVITLCIFLSLVVLMSGFSGIPNITPINLSLVLIAIPLMITSEILRFIFLGLGKIEYYASIGVFRIIVWTVSNIFMFVIIGMNPTATMIAWIIQLLLTALVFSILLNKHVKIKIFIDIKYYWEILRSGSKGLLTQMGSRLMYSGDVFFVNFLFPVAVIGNYSVATSVVRIMQRSANVAGALIFPISSRKQDREVDQLVARVSRHMVFLNSFLAIVIFITGSYLLTFVFGSEFENSFGFLAWLLPGFVALAPPIVIGPYLWGLNYPRIVLFAPYIAFVLNILLLFWMAPIFEATSASIASSVGYIFWSISITVYFHKKTDISYRDVLVIKSSDLQAITLILRVRLLALRDRILHSHVR